MEISGWTKSSRQYSRRSYYGSGMMSTSSYFRQSAISACMLLTCQGLCAGGERSILYDVPSQVFCLERPSPVPAAEKSWGYCETSVPSVPLNRSGAFFHSGEVIRIRIQNGHVTSSYTVTIDDTQKITADAPQFRPQTPLSLVAPPAAREDPSSPYPIPGPYPPAQPPSVAPQSAPPRESPHTTQSRSNFSPYTPPLRCCPILSPLPIHIFLNYYYPKNGKTKLFLEISSANFSHFP